MPKPLYPVGMMKQPKPRLMDETVMDQPAHLKVSGVVHTRSFERNILLTAKGSGIVAVGRIFAQGSRFVIIALLARLLGAEQYGLYNLAITAATLTSQLAQLGLNSALVRYVAILAGRQDDEGLWGALQVGVGISAFLSVLYSAGLFALAYPIAEHVFNDPKLAPLLQLASPFVSLLTLSEILAGAARGFKKMEYMVIAQNFAQLLVRLVLTVVLALVGLDAFRAVVIFGLSDGVASIILIYFLNKEFSFKRPLHAARRDTRAIIGFALPLWLSEMMTAFRSNLQTLLLGSLNTITSAGIFSVAANVNLLGHTSYTAITLSARPLIAELDDRGDREQLARLYQTTTRWMLTLNLPVFLALVLFSAPILSIFGESFVDGSTALALLAVAELLNVGTGMCGAVIDMTGHSRLKFANAIVQAGLSVGANVLLIPRWGLLGAATATLIANAIINLLKVIQVWILFRILPYNLSFIKPAVASLAALATGLTVGRWLPAEATLLHTGIQVLIMFAVYAGIVLLLGLSPEERMVLARLRRRARATLYRS